MTISRTGGQIPVKPHQRSHMSGKHQMRFAARLKDNLDLQCFRLEQELCPRSQPADEVDAVIESAAVLTVETGAKA